MSSYFENKANITAIEFVPMTAGQLVIEVSEIQWPLELFNYVYISN